MTRGATCYFHAYRCALAVIEITRVRKRGRRFANSSLSAVMTRTACIVGEEYSKLARSSTSAHAAAAGGVSCGLRSGCRYSLFLLV